MPRAPKKAVTKKATSAAKTSKTKKPDVIQTPVQPTVSQSSFFSSKAFRFGIGILVVLAILAYTFKSQFVVAIVNGQILTRSQFNSEMEKQVGKQVLQTMITKALIEQEAQRRHIVVSQSEVDAQLKTVTDSLSKQGQTLDQALAAQGMTKSDFVDQLRLQRLIEKMLADKITVSDQEITDYIAKNKDSLPQNEDDATLKASVKNQLEQQKLSLQFQQFIAGLQQKAKITQFVNF